MWQLIAQIAAYLVASVLLGFIVGYLYGRARAARLFKQREADWGARVDTAERARETINNEKIVYQTQSLKLKSELTAMETLLRARESTVAEQAAKLKDQHDLLTRIAEKDSELTRLRWRLSELEQRYGPGGNLPVRTGPLVPYEHDDLKRIRGINLVSADLLKRMSINTFRQVAQWTESDLARVAELLDASPTRLRQENWVGQAKEQHRLKYGETL